MQGIVAILVDIVVLVLPIRVVLRLHISVTKKGSFKNPRSSTARLMNSTAGLTILFGLGGVATVGAVVRLAYIFKALAPEVKTLGDFETAFYAEIFTFLEMGLGVICSNAPALTALIRSIRKDGLSMSDNSRSRKQHYELQHDDRHRATCVNGSGHDSSSLDHIVPKPGHVVRSTQVTVDYEERAG